MQCNTTLRVTRRAHKLELKNWRVRGRVYALVRLEIFMKEHLHCILIIALVIYFGVSAIGKASLHQEQIEATRLHIQVLKLQLLELKSNALNHLRETNEGK